MYVWYGSRIAATALPSRLRLASNRLVKWKTFAEIVARDSRGETEGGNAYLLYSTLSTSRPSITKLLCRLQKRRKNRRSLVLLPFFRLSFTPCPSLSLSPSFLPQSSLAVNRVHVRGSCTERDYCGPPDINCSDLWSPTLRSFYFRPDSAGVTF